MANYENIKLRKDNMTMIDGYFYMIDNESDLLIVKTDDGTQSFSYPLDTNLNASYPVTSLEYDGRNFWSLETSPTANSVIIRRWYIDNFICKQRNKFDLNEVPGVHKYSSSAFTVEHYHETFTADELSGEVSLSISDGSKLTSGMTVVLGPNVDGNIEEFTVNSAGADYVNINGFTSYAYSTGDSISFFKSIYLFNDYDGINSDSGALYKINPYTGAYVSKTAGNEYKGINACTFFEIPLATFDTGVDVNSLIYIKGTNMIFLNIDVSPIVAYGSMVMDNIQSDLINIIPVYDLSFDETNIYRLQKKATYFGSTVSWSSGNYQLATLQPFITSISLKASPAILPANGINQATITAIVKDQFDQPIAGKNVSFTDNDSSGSPSGVITTTPVSTDSDGKAVTAYRAGTEAKLVTITATASQG